MHVPSKWKEGEELTEYDVVTATEDPLLGAEADGRISIFLGSSVLGSDPCLRFVLHVLTRR